MSGTPTEVASAEVSAAELAKRAEARGIAILPAALPAVAKGAAWLRGCVALIRAAGGGK